MIKYLDVQQKAQEELNHILEPGSLPTLDDEDSLPYTTAIVKEVLRWNRVGPIGQFPFPSVYIFTVIGNAWLV